MRKQTDAEWLHPRLTRQQRRDRERRAAFWDVAYCTIGGLVLAVGGLAVVAHGFDLFKWLAVFWGTQ